MDTERLYRMSIPGVIFLVTLIYFYILFGGNFQLIKELLPKENLATLIALIFTTPVLGFVISSLAFGIIYIICGYRVYINLPKSDLFFLIVRRDDKLWAELGSSKKTIKRKALKEFYWKYQSYIRANLNERTFKFLERRWHFFWIHVNSILAIVLSFFVSILLRIKTACYRSHNTGLSNIFLIGIYLLIIVFIILAIIQARAVRQDAIQVEEEAVLRSGIKN